MRKSIDACYYWLAMHMPLRWQWQYNFAMSARFYFENCEAPEFVGWPWRWTMNWKD